MLKSHIWVPPLVGLIFAVKFLTLEGWWGDEGCNYCISHFWELKHRWLQCAGWVQFQRQHRKLLVSEVLFAGVWDCFYTQWFVYLEHFQNFNLCCTSSTLGWHGRGGLYVVGWLVGGFLFRCFCLFVLFGGVVLIFVSLFFVLFFCGGLRQGHMVINKWDLLTWKLINLPCGKCFYCPSSKRSWTRGIIWI